MNYKVHQTAKILSFLACVSIDSSSKLTIKYSSLKMSSDNLSVLKLLETIIANQAAADERLKELISELAENVARFKADINEKIKKLEVLVNKLDAEKVTSTINSFDSKIAFALNEIRSLKSLKSDHEMFQRDTNKINLLLSGIDEPADEVNEDLVREIESTLLKTTGIRMDIDTAYRIGKVNTKFPRPVKVRFNKISERNAVWNSRFNSKPPIYINEDLPYSTRRDNEKLRAKIRELKEKTEFFEIKWNEKLIKTEKHIFKIKDGILTQSDNNLMLPQNGDHHMKYSQPVNHYHQTMKITVINDAPMTILKFPKK